MSAVANSARKNPQSPIRNPQFTDTDFFRRLVAERSNNKGCGCADIAQFRSKILHAALSVPLAASNNPILHLEAIVDIAAFCELFAVDITIPASRSSRLKPAKQNRKGKSL